MVRFESDVDTQSSTELDSSSTEASISEAYTSEASISEASTNIESSSSYDQPVWSDGGRNDYCRCHYDYRGESCELFCPRCAKQVQDDYEDDEVYFQQSFYAEPARDENITTESGQKDLADKDFCPATRQIGRDRDSDSTFDSWPSASEEEVLNRNGEMERYRRKEIIEKDLKLLAGSGPTTEENYDGDIDDKDTRQERLKKFTKKMARRKKYTKIRNIK